MQNAIPQPGGGFTPEQAESFGDTCSLLDAVIAAYSARISVAASADETEQLQAEQQAYLHERCRLAVTDDAAVPGSGATTQPGCARCAGRTRERRAVPSPHLRPGQHPPAQPAGPPHPRRRRPSPPLVLTRET